MNRAQKRDAVLEQKFYFRKDVFLPGRQARFPCTEPTSSPPCGEVKSPCSEAKAPAQPTPCSEVNASAHPTPCSEAETNVPSTPGGEAKPNASPSPCSEAQNAGSSPSAPAGKEKVLRNCYPEVEPPETLERMPVEKEYEEMTINEIINGKVR
jgi:glutamate--cysteine ligase catalytic subunit